jgi:methionyl-tRNA formyltransferase
MRLVFMGTPQAAVPTLERLIADEHQIAAVYTQPDRPSGRGQRLAASPVKQVALDSGIEVHQPLKIKTDEAFNEFRSLNADAAIVVAYGRILPDRWLAAFPKGAINVHFSLLPKYRGAAPVNWAIAHGETETGVTTMQMDAGLDTGDILLQCSVAIGPEETSIQLMERLSGLGAKTLSETLSTLETIKPRKQDADAVTLAPILRKEDGLIDWSRTAREIANRIRGFQPFPASFTFANGSRLTIWTASTADASNDEVPGHVISASGDAFVVACGEGALRVAELQPEGKRRMSARDFLNGTRFEAGTILG